MGCPIRVLVAHMCIYGLTHLQISREMASPICIWHMRMSAIANAVTIRKGVATMDI